MARLSSQEKFWKTQVDNPALSTEERAKYADKLERAKRSRKKRARYKGVLKDIADDPEPVVSGFDPDPYFDRKHAEWEKRHPKAAQKNKKLLAATAAVEPKPAPVEAHVATPVAKLPAPVRVEPISPLRPVSRRPASEPVIERWPKEGISGFFYRERFWNLSIEQQKLLLFKVNRDPGLLAEWETICGTMRAPVVARQPLTREEQIENERAKRKNWGMPPARIEAPPRPTIESPEKPTMANSAGGIGVDRPIVFRPRPEQMNPLPPPDLDKKG